MIICVPKQTLSAQQKAAITKKGYIVIECDDPEKIRVINAEQNMDTSDWFMAALYATTTGIPVSKSEHFVAELYKRLKKKEELPKEEFSNNEAVSK